MTQKVLEGTGAEIAAQIAAFGQQHLRVTVQSEDPEKPSFDREQRHEIRRRFAELTKHTVPLPTRSFTAEDFYLPVAGEE